MTRDSQQILLPRAPCVYRRSPLSPLSAFPHRFGDALKRGRIYRNQEAIAIISCSPWVRPSAT